MLSLNTNNTDFLTQLGFFSAYRRGEPRQQAAAAHTHNDGVYVGHLLQDLKPNGALPGDNILIIEGVHEHRAGCLGVAFCLGQCLIYGSTVQLNLRAVVAGGSNFGEGSAQRHVNARFNAQLSGRHRHPLSVISRRCSHHTVCFLSLAKFSHANIRAACFKRAGTLQVLAFEEHLRTEFEAQRPRMRHRCALNNPREQFSC